VRDRWRFSLEWNDSMFIPLEISRDQLMVLINGRAVASRKHHGVSGMIGSFIHTLLLSPNLKAVSR
jgi:hypothetical protein